MTVARSTHWRCMPMRLLAFGLFFGLLSNAPVNAAVIIYGALEMQAVDCSLGSDCQPLNDAPLEKASLGEDASLPGSDPGESGGAGAPGPVNASGGALVADVPGDLLCSDPALVVWLAHSRFLLRPTLLPSGTFRPPRLSS